ncbi:hypothetical protein AB4305_30180 [Nocardia sp. 2YAB30]|uniref:hypothetical protein n=1 Tax=Nocardia sp. 2YAB30 TaxID=3233022 RepID=UPI003F9E917E
MPLPAPIAAKSLQEIEKPSQIIGMLITGATAHEQLCSTADPAAVQLCIALAAKVKYKGQPESFEEATLYIPTAGKHSIDDLIHQSREYAHMGTLADDDTHRIYNLAVSLLLYLCSDQRDTRPPPASPGKKGKSARKPAAKVVDLGFHVGPALQAARRDTTSSAGSSGGSVRAHLRRGHWHTYWTGRRADPSPSVRWLHPILVNKTEHTNHATVIDVAPPPANTQV